MSMRCVLQLMTHREDVDAINLEALKRLPSAPVMFHAQDAGASADLLKAACPVSSCCARHWVCSVVLELYPGMSWPGTSTHGGAVLSEVKRSQQEGTYVTASF